QRNQMQRIIEIMGMPNKERWPMLIMMPEFSQLHAMQANNARLNKPFGLANWYNQTIANNKYPPNKPGAAPAPEGLDPLQGLLEYDPEKRLRAEQALKHPYFTSGAKPAENCFEGVQTEYPHRRVSNEDNDIRTSSLPGTKRSGLPDDSLMRPAKRL